jgi:hypothetical protein
MTYVPVVLYVLVVRTISSILPIFSILAVLAGHPDVALVTSLVVGRGYHSAATVHNQTYKRVTNLALSMQSQSTNQHHPFRSRAVKFGVWATKRNTKVGFGLFHPILTPPPSPAPSPREPKKGWELPITPLDDGGAHDERGLGFSDLQIVSHHVPDPPPIYHQLHIQRLRLSKGQSNAAAVCTELN